MNQIKLFLSIAIFFCKTFGSSGLEVPTNTERKSFECLVVDDNSLNRKLLGNMIKNAANDLGEVTLYYAENEEAAVSILADHTSIQLAVIDGEITPGIGGTKLVTHIRHTFKGFISAWSTDLTEQTGMMKAGANYDLNKPASLDDIKCMILTWYESLCINGLA